MTLVAQEKKAHCLIISANQVAMPYPVYPLGAAYVTGALKRAGHQVVHFDLLADGGIDSLSAVLAENQFDLIGVSIRNLDTVDSADSREYLSDVVGVVQRIRAESDGVVVLGGPAFSIMPETLMELFGADYGVVGEGEQAMPWLASEIAAGRCPEEKILRFPQNEQVWQGEGLTSSTADYYTNRGGMLNVQTKRGCPYNCFYCSYPTIEGRKVRYRNPASVVEEVIRLQKENGAKYIFFTDSVFNDPGKRYLEIAEELIRKNNSLPWCAFFRPSDISREEFRLLKRAGLQAAELGTDAACDETLAGIGKTFTFDDVLKVHGNAIAEDVKCAHFIMFGGPNENRISLEKGLKNIELLQKSVVIAYVGIRLFPGTAIVERAIADGVITADQSLLEPVFYYSPQISREEIDTALLTAFAGKETRVYPCHLIEKRIPLLHKFGKVGPMWDILLGG